METLTFNEVNFSPVELNGQIWLTSADLAEGLGYQNTKSVSNLYNNNSDEFSERMTTVIDLMTVRKTGNIKMKTRIFSLRGCHLIAMFARTKVAKEFRKWVLDILDKEVGQPVVVGNGELTAEQTLPLRNAVSKLATKSGLLYPDVYKMVHQQFAVDHIKELTPEQLLQAIEYIHNLTVNRSAHSPMADFTHNQYIMQVKSEVMNYVHLLQRMIVAAGNTLPKHPDFDKEEICRAFIVSMIRHNRMMLSFDYQLKPVISFIPAEHAVVSSESISDVVQFADKAQLPSIINEAVKRLEK